MEFFCVQSSLWERTTKVSSVWTTFGIVHNKVISHGREWKRNSGLTNNERGDWEEVTNKIDGQWRHLLDNDEDTTYPRQWLGFYVKGEEDPAFDFQHANNSTPECLQWYNLTLPLPVQCFMIGIYSRCLREWVRSIQDQVPFIRLRIFILIVALRRRGRKRRLLSFMTWWPLWDGTRTNGDGLMEATFFIILRKMVVTLSTICTHVPQVRQTNGKAASRFSFSLKIVGGILCILSGTRKCILGRWS